MTLANAICIGTYAGLVIVYTGIILKIHNKILLKRHKREERKNINGWLKGTINPEDVSIDAEGEVIDYDLGISNTADLIETRLKNDGRTYVKVLIFTSVFRHDSTKTVQIESLLGTISKLGCFRMYWVDDTSEPINNQRQIINMITQKLLRCDNLLNEKDINVTDLIDYDIVFHPRAGLKSSYETTVEVLKRRGKTEAEQK